MSSKFLDKTGLDTFWAKIKSTFQTLGNLVTAWGSTPSDTKYPSEKLVKTSLDAKAPNVPSEVTIATGDKLLIADSSDSSKVKRASVTFDTGVPTAYLCRNGAFNAVKEADVTWGGSFRAELSPAEFGNMARNLIHNPITTAITFDKSTDGGVTWASQTISDALKRALCNLAGGGAGSNFGIPNSAYSGISDPSLLQGRITIYAISGPNVTTAENTWFYGIVKRILMKVSRSGSAKMKVEYQTWPHFIADDGVWGDVGTFDVQGDSGWNSIPFDNTLGGSSGQLTSGRIIALRFTFWIASGSTPRISIINLGFLPQIHWKSNAGNIPLLGVPIYINDDGTGAINAAAKLQTSRKLAVSLSNTSTDTSFNGSADVTNIKTTGTLGIGNGGTGATTARGAMYNTLGQEPTLDSALDDNRLVPIRNNEVSATNGVFRWFKLSNVWNYIKDNISSVLGLTATAYGGNAATATTAAGYTSGGAIDTALQGKVDKVSGKGLSTNDFTTDEKDKLSGIAEGAEVNVQSDWNQTDSTSDDYIKNKPQNLVQDASYVHTDNNYTTEDKGKVASAVQPGDLGSAAYKDVPATGDASTTQVVMGSDSRLSDARPASDVSAWAKADTKPTYTASDVGAAESSHQHSTSDITSGTFPVGRGGTGKASVTAGNYLVGNGTSALTEETPKQVGNNVLPALDTGSDNVFETDYIIGSNHTSGNTDDTTFVRRTAGKLWNYIKTKIYNGSLGSENRPVYWTGSNLSLSKPSPNANLMGTVGKTTAAMARADTDILENTTINCNNGSVYYLNALKFIPNVPYTFFIPSVNADKSRLVASTAMTVYQIGASSFQLGTNATYHLDKAGGSSTQHEIVFVYRVGTTLYIFHQY